MVCSGAVRLGMERTGQARRGKAGKELLMTTTTPVRRMLRARPGDPKLCRCGLRRAFVVEMTRKQRNRWGLLQDVTRNLSYCSTHGRQYAAKFNLEVPS